MSREVMPRVSLRAFVPLARRPDLWPTAIRQAAVLAPPRWWRRAPFLPVPSAAYLRFRLITAYGGDGTTTTVTADAMGRDIVTYLAWCRSRPLG